MKILFFDSGPIITLAMNNLLSILEKLHADFDGTFAITPAVKLELVDKPLTTNRFRLEALQIQQLLDSNVLSIVEETVPRHLTDLANRIYTNGIEHIKIVSEAEMTVVEQTLFHDVTHAVIDERTVRLLIEDPHSLTDLLQRRIQQSITLDKRALAEFRSYLKPIHIIRSSELVLVAYKKGYFKHLLPSGGNPSQTLVEALLWAVRTKGCAISTSEIEILKRAVLRG